MYRPRLWWTRITEMGLPSSAWNITSGWTNGWFSERERKRKRGGIAHHRKYILNSPGQLCVIQFRAELPYVSPFSPSLRLLLRGRNGVSSHLPNRFSLRIHACSLTHERRKSLRGAKLFVSTVVSSRYDARVWKAQSLRFAEDFWMKCAALIFAFVQKFF